MNVFNSKKLMNICQIYTVFPVPLWPKIVSHTFNDDGQDWAHGFRNYPNGQKHWRNNILILFVCVHHSLVYCVWDVLIGHIGILLELQSYNEHKAKHADKHHAVSYLGWQPMLTSLGSFLLCFVWIKSHRKPHFLIPLNISLIMCALNHPPHQPPPVTIPSN